MLTRSPNSEPSTRRARPRPTGGPRSARATSWLSSPLLAILAIVALLGVLLWLLETDERTAQREDLIRDALWVEQALRFQSDSETAHVARLARDLAATALTPTAFATQASHVLQLDRDILSIDRLDAEGRLVQSLPAPGPALSTAPAQVVVDHAAIVRATGQPAMTPPFRLATGRSVVAFLTPVAAGGHAEGTIAAYFALDLLLYQHVPWWIAEKRAMTLKDGTGATVATRTSITPDAEATAYTVEIGAPFTQLWLTVTSYRTRSTLAQNSVIGAMIGLGLFAAAGLLARERHIRRRRAAEDALGEEHAFRRAMESSLQVGVRARDLEGRILYVNPAFCRLFGYSEEELVGRTSPMPYWLPEDLERTQKLHNAILAGQALNQGLEFTFRRKDGSRVEVLIYEAPLIDARGEHRGWMGSFVDITDRKRAEEAARIQTERMQHTARLVTLGEMASLLAHDLNQPLATIRSFAAGLENITAGERERRPEMAGALQAIGTSADRAGRIIRSVQDFVRRREPRLETMNLRECVAETLTLLEPELRQAHILAETELQPLLPPVRIDRILIEQVLVNLARNAIDAMRDLPGERRRLVIRAVWPDAGGRIEVVIRDWGRGVDPALVEKLFQPFVSTKSGGMGLGLTICRSILELHGSHLAYVPSEEPGALFRFSLAAAETTP